MQVCWAIVRAGHPETALGITGSMVRHGHLKQAAQAALCMVLPGSSPVEQKARQAAGNAELHSCQLLHYSMRLDVANAVLGFWEGSSIL